MKILVAGGSGFIGKELIKTLSKHHQIVVLGRDKHRLEKIFPDMNIEKVTWEMLKAYDAAHLDVVINLAGSNIGEKRWSPKIKHELISSRTTTNEKLIRWLINKNANPHYYCANAVGIYGAMEGDAIGCDEDTSVYEHATPDFLKQIGLAWEASLKEATDKNIPVTTLRFGVVLKKQEGMLKKIELPYRLGLGSLLGDGSQIISWVYYRDLIKSVIFLLAKPDMIGPINITAPQPVSQKEFAQQFAKILKRPMILKTPAWVIKLLFGEMGDYLLLKGQKVFPKRLVDAGFKFDYPHLSAALCQEYSNQNT